MLADSGALLKEIPGGCMCCVNGLPMQVGLNTLLRQGKPDRLLIEPTGLGHPKQVRDLCTTPESEQALQRWWQQNGGDRQLIHSEHGKVDGHLLDLPRRNLAELPASAAHSHQHVVKKGLAALSLPEHQRWRRSLNSGQGYQACGWIFDADQRRAAYSRRAGTNQPSGR